MLWVCCCLLCVICCPFLFGPRSEASLLRLRFWLLLSFSGRRTLFCRGQKNLSSTYWYMLEKQRGMVSSNSRFQAVLYRQYSANLSISRELGGPSSSSSLFTASNSSQPYRKCILLHLSVCYLLCTISIYVSTYLPPNYLSTYLPI